jgi:hypothetical protein
MRGRRAAEGGREYAFDPERGGARAASCAGSVVRAWCRTRAASSADEGDVRARAGASAERRREGSTSRAPAGVWRTIVRRTERAMARARRPGPDPFPSPRNVHVLSVFCVFPWTNIPTSSSCVRLSAYSLPDGPAQSLPSARLSNDVLTVVFEEASRRCTLLKCCGEAGRCASYLWMQTPNSI